MNNIATYPLHIEILKENTIQSISTSLAYRKADNVESNILPSENIIIDRLIGRFDEMELFCKQLNEKFNFMERYSILDCFLGILVLTKPSDLNKSREDKKLLEELNRKIAKQAFQLAELIEKRSELHNTTQMSSDTYYSISDVVNDAAQDNYYYQSYPKTKFNQLFYQFDLKYWPNIAQIVDAIGIDADCAKVEASDSITKAGTKSKRPSVIDSVRAFFMALLNYENRHPGITKKVLNLSNSALTSVFNIGLALDPNEIVSDDQFKTAKSRIKKEMNAG